MVPKTIFGKALSTKIDKLIKSGETKTSICKKLYQESGYTFKYFRKLISENYPLELFKNNRETLRKWDHATLDSALKMHSQGISWAQLALHFGLSKASMRFRLEGWKGTKSKMFADFLLGEKDAQDMMRVYGLSRPEFMTYKKEALADKIIHTDGKGVKPNEGEKALDLIQMAGKGIKEFDRSTQTAEVKVSTKLPYIGLWCSGDWHIESYHTDLEALRKHIDLVAKTPSMYVSFCGDAMDNGIPGGPHPNILNDRTVPVRIARIAASELFRKIKDKLLCVTTGCHIQWSINVDDYNLYDDLTRNMGITYLGPGGTVNLKFSNGAEYRARFMHKYTGSSAENKLNTCLNYLKSQDASCDIVQVAHNHISAGAIVDWQGKSRAFIRSGSYKSMDTYAKLLNIRGQERAHNPVLILGTRDKYMRYEPSVEEAIKTLKNLNGI